MNIPQEEFDRLSAQKLEIENELEELNKILESEGGVGMKGSLVDAEDFPRADIDIYKVRQTRQRINVLQNDYVKIIDQIEKALPDKLNTNGHTASNHSNGSAAASYPTDDRLRTFIKVTNIAPNSPSDQAGFKNNDEIVQFGPFTTGSLTEIAEHVKQRVNKIILVKVLRLNETNMSKASLILKLEPKQWDGVGLLGCKFNHI